MVRVVNSEVEGDASGERPLATKVYALEFGEVMLRERGIGVDGGRGRLFLTRCHETSKGECQRILC